MLHADNQQAKLQFCVC